MRDPLRLNDKSSTSPEFPFVADFYIGLGFLKQQNMVGTEDLPYSLIKMKKNLITPKRRVHDCYVLTKNDDSLI